MAAYAVLANLYAFGISDVACGSVATATRQAILDARNSYADTKMRARYKLPLQTPYPLDLVQNICALAAWDLWMVRGGNPTAGTDAQYETRGQLALKWFDDVERQRAHPDVIEAEGGTEPGYAAPEVISKPLQGWYPGSGS